MIFLQVSVAFALFGVLQGLKSGVEQSISETRADLLLVHSSLSLGDSLPLGLLEQIKSVSGVKVVIPVGLLGSVYQKPDQHATIVAIRPDPGWMSAFTYTIAPEAEAAFKKSRTAALVNAGIVTKYGFKVGDRIPLNTPLAQASGSTVWTFDMVGTFTDSDFGAADNNILVNFDYFDQARAVGKGTVAHYNVTIADPKLAASVEDEIDRQFANSANETRTDSLRQLAQVQMQSIGDLNFLIRAIVSAVFVALLFATGTMMMQSIRERTPELAVLKTLGFGDRTLVMLILAEAVAVCIAAAATGLVLATLVFPFAAKIVRGISMPFVVVELGFAYAVVVALVSAAVPAVRAARLQVVSALAER